MPDDTPPVGPTNNHSEQDSAVLDDLKYIYEILMARMDQQVQERENLSLKATFLATTVSIVIGFVWTIKSDMGGVFFWSAFAFHVLAITVLARVIHPREYEVVPKPTAVIATANESGLVEVLRQAVANIGRPMNSTRPHTWRELRISNSPSSYSILGS